ncbi:hypothetical protein FJY68_08700 [candidate division WOR-3 bacterium]|uniref:Uncharacterized protein n=1 Tax=candidate division WOR-3 bacterium TaxID=2052148 RepID=A0A937XDW2_UNCW3|nr:hypothetical protein [candidate division WOR-3 bacterium]
MDAKTAKGFFDNQEWFNLFFEQLSGLYDSLGKALAELELEESAKRWYYKNTEQPSVPDKFMAFYADGASRQLAAVALLAEPKSEKLQVKEPALAIIAHDAGSDATHGVAMNVLNGQKIRRCEQDNDGITFHGELTWDVRFRGFFVPLDAFSEGNCSDLDAAVREKIAGPLQEMLGKHFSKPGKKSKSGA